MIHAVMSSLGLHRLRRSTDFGVSKLSNGSTRWVDAAPGMPAVATYGLTYSPEANRIYAATHGRGAYFLRVG
jgi:hypothetical protein